MSDAFADLDRALSGAEVLDLARSTLVRYVVFPSDEAADAVTLFAAATHAVDSLEMATRLVIKSPEKRCGKSRLLDVLTPLTHNALITVNISPAAIVHSLTETSPPTIVLDEADATFGKALKGDERAEVLRGILNAGFTRGRPYKRYDVASRAVEDRPTFAFAVLAGIGDMPDTIEDRAVIIALRRKAPAESAARYRIRRDAPGVQVVGDQLAAWVTTHAQGIGEAEPVMPDGLNDRAEDAWEGLLAVADAAGGTWPERARKAAVKLSGAAEEAAGHGRRLLSDLRDVFDDQPAMHTAAILDALHKIDEAPWGRWYGHPLEPRDLAGLLHPYEVRSRKVNIGGVSKQGYRRDDLFEQWQRYLPPLSGRGDGISGTSGTSQVKPIPDSTTHPEPMEPEVPEVPEGSGGHNSLTSQVPEVPEVPEGAPRTGGEADEPTTAAVTEGNGHRDALGWSALSAEPVAKGLSASPNGHKPKMVMEEW